MADRRPRRGAALALGLVLALLAAEGGARLLRLFPRIPPIEYRASPTGMFVPDPAAGFRLAPGFSFPDEHFTTNALGMRDRERSPGPPPEGTFRVAVLGDSFTAGVSVADGQQYPLLLETALGEVLPDGPAVEIWDLGVPHTGPDQSFLLLQELWDEVQPDAVVFTSFLGNDPLDDVEGPGYHHVRKGEMCKRGWGPWPGSPYNDQRARLNRPVLAPDWPDGWLVRHSYAWRQLLQQIHNLRSATVWDYPWGMVPFDYEAFGTVPWLYYQEVPPKMEGGWVISEDVLGRMKRFVGERGRPLLIVSLPGAMTVDPRRLQRGLDEGLGGGPGFRPQLDPQKPARRLAEIASRLGLPLLDLEGPLVAAQGPEEMYYVDDSHWTAAGQRVAAGALGRELGRLGWVEGVDPEALDAALLRAVPPGTTPTVFQGGFRPVFPWERDEEERLR